MKQIKFYCLVVCAGAFFYSCEKESLNLPEEEAGVQEKITFSEFMNSGVDVNEYISNVLASEKKSRSSNKSHSDVSYDQPILGNYCDFSIEDFEKGEINVDKAGVFFGPLNENTCCHKFDTGDILPGISLSAEGRVLGLYGQLVRGSMSKVIYAEGQNADLYVDFTSGDVNSFTLDVLSFPYLESAASQQVTVDVFAADGELIHNETIDASIAGTYWSYVGDETVSRVVLSSTNNDAWIGVDNVAFGVCTIPDADDDGCLDGDDSNNDSNLEATVNVGSCDSGVENRMTADCGVMFSDVIDGIENGSYKNNGEVVRTVAHISNEWLSAGLISSAEKDALVACAAKAGL